MRLIFKNEFGDPRFFFCILKIILSSKYEPGPWTPFMDGVHRPPIMDRVHGPPIFATKNKIRKLKKQMNPRYYFKLIVIKDI